MGPLITFERKERSSLNLVQTQYGASLCRDHKTTPKWAWPGSRDQFHNFGTRLITFERNDQSASNLVQRWTTHPACVCKQNNAKMGVAWVTCRTAGGRCLYLTTASVRSVCVSERFFHLLLSSLSSSLECANAGRSLPHLGNTRKD